MNMKRKVCALLLTLIVGLLIAIIPGTAFAAVPHAAKSALSSQSLTGKVCLNVTGHFSAKLPPKGFVVIIASHLLANCTLVDSPMQIVPISQMALQNKSLSPSYWNSTKAYIAQREWDCCGIQMNALYTTFGWNYNGGGVVPNSTYNTTQYHQEYGPAGPGWWLGYQNLYYSSGCWDCWQESLTGNAGFPYRGSFDPSGSLYYNSFSNTMTAYGNGGWACSGSYNLRRAIYGWSHQSWCTYGQV